MKYSEELHGAMVSLTERYGITLSEVPDRFKEKIVHLIGPSHRQEIDHAFRPLITGALRNLRIRATHRIDSKKLAECRDQVAQTEGYDNNDVIDAIHLWISIFKIKTDDNTEEIIISEPTDEPFSQEIIDDVGPIVDETAITAPLDAEIVFNQFDQPSLVQEPQVSDYNGNFNDLSFETVADFAISDEESQLNKRLESSKSINEIEADRVHEKAEKSRKKTKKYDPKPEFTQPVYEPPPFEKTTAEGTVDGAFKALRDGNPSLASRIMMELARNGDTRAQFHLGEFYLEGTGIEKSLEKGKYWLRKAASRGSVAAKGKLEDIENEANSGGCCGCLLVGFVLFVVMQILANLL